MKKPAQFIQKVSDSSLFDILDDDCIRKLKLLETDLILQSIQIPEKEEDRVSYQGKLIGMTVELIEYENKYIGEKFLEIYKQRCDLYKVFD